MSARSLFLPSCVSLIDGYPASDMVRAYWEDLLSFYELSGLAPPHPRQEVERGCCNEPQKLWGCLWEAMLYRHFKERDFKFRTENLNRCGQNGPDLGLVDKNRTIWLEAVVPQGIGLPPSRSGMIAQELPDDEVVLRWTSVIRDKNAQYKRRLDGRVVAPDDPYIIAVNSYMLSQQPVQDKSISRPPYAISAVYPVGKLKHTFNSGGGYSERTSRFSISKKNGSNVLTTSFLDEKYAGISALIGYSHNNMLYECPYLIAVHNVCARNPVRVGQLGVRPELEYIPVNDGDGMYKLIW